LIRKDFKIKKHHNYFNFDHAEIYWHGNKFVVYLLNSLSLVIPAGEQFFVKSVAHFSNANDFSSKSNLNKFIKQEMNHSIYHKKLNKKIISDFYLRNIPDRVNSFLIKYFITNYGVKHTLCVTICLEYLTYILSKYILQSNIFINNFNSNDIIKLWIWHSIEEIDHKSVAYNVGKDISHIRLCLTMALVSIPSLMISLGANSLIQILKSKTMFSFSDAYCFLIKDKFIRFFCLELLNFFNQNYNPSIDDDSELLKNIQKLSLNIPE